MLNLLRESFLTLNLWGRFTFFLLIGMTGLNIYECLEARYIGSYDRATSHAIFAGTLFLLKFVILQTSLYLSRGKNFYLSAKSVHENGYEQKRMAMYEKLLEKNEKEIQ